MPVWICVTCANHFPSTAAPPPACPVCDDPRQWVGWDGQRWTTAAELSSTHRTVVRAVEPGLWGIGVEPRLAIGQRGLVVTTPEGNVLWDVPGHVDAPAFDAVRDLGGLAAVSASHPHFYGAMVEWAHAFDAPILLPVADRSFVTRPDPAILFYGDEARPVAGVHLVRCGGHFPGSAVLHWPGGAAGRGALLTGDTITVVQDRDWMSIMWSYPNLIPLDPATVRTVAARVEPLEFDRIYGGWWDRTVASGAKAKLAASIERYVRIIDDGPPG